MRVLVFSDTHGKRQRVEHISAKHPDIDTVIFLGDVLDDLRDIPSLEGRTVYSVAGNCDFTRSVPMYQTITLEGMRVFFTHGHEYRVKWTTDALINTACLCRADIVLYGHTHVPECTWQNEMYVINPGSLGNPREGAPSYAIIEITKEYILPNIIYLDRSEMV